MKLISPSGVRIEVSDSRGETLRQKGYRLPEAAVKAAAPEGEAPKRRRPARKASVETKTEDVNTESS